MTQKVLRNYGVTELRIDRHTEFNIAIFFQIIIYFKPLLSYRPEMNEYYGSGEIVTK